VVRQKTNRAGGFFNKFKIVNQRQYSEKANCANFFLHQATINRDDY